MTTIDKVTTKLPSVECHFLTVLVVAVARLGSQVDTAFDATRVHPQPALQVPVVISVLLLELIKLMEMLYL